MYTEFFGLREKPFRLVPNPDYLFLGVHHREALAHLVYAVGAGEGFLAIIGEVGTGKTTLCRAFLEGLDEATVSAYLFNPALEAKDLMRAICTEFKIDHDAHADMASLSDAVNGFLLAQAQAGNDVILLVDEAQGLTRDVLEQLRLLSNLETTRRKLIQIILVGQPELEDTLASHDLRQLRQRISLSCRILPLSLEDTGRYIAHRMEKAGSAGPPPFTSGAVRRIHRYSKGIPRLINIICDRRLLAAVTDGHRQIDKKTVRAAARDLGGGIGSLLGRRRLTLAAVAAGVALLALTTGAAVGLWHTKSQIIDHGHQPSTRNQQPAAPAK